MLHHVGGEHHGRALGGQAAQQLLQGLLGQGIQARERLVQDHQLRLMRQGAQQLHPLGHALGQMPHLAACGVAEAIGFQKLQGAPSRAGRRHAFQAGEEDDGVHRRHAAVEAALFGQEADAVAHPAHVPLAQHQDAARVGSDQAQDHPQGGGLACAIGPEEAQEPSAPRLEAQVVHRLKAAETLAHAFDGQSARHPPARASPLPAA